ncbi:MAG: DUF1638 domain-containing protein [Deltaproteobacteria bacterium]|nr:DUF1638 domain-containing protein [Deltaproteobacteria bacterium]
MPFPNKIITCRALAPMVAELLNSDEPITELDAALHLQPERLRQALLDAVAELEQEDETILLGYGLCGRALEGVQSQKSTLILPRVDDCVGMLLGSRQRHRAVLSERPGTYFLDPCWLDNELNIFEQMGKGLEHIPEKRRKQLLKVALKHYDHLVLLCSGQPQETAEARCRELAHEHDMQFSRLTKELGLLDKLLHGPWEEPEFIVAPPGTPIPMF